MWDSGHFDVVAFLAFFCFHVGVGVVVFEVEFVDEVAGAHGLNVAPEAEKNIEVADEAHYFGFGVC